MARTFYSENLALLKDVNERANWFVAPDSQSAYAYVGSITALDPCSRYHADSTPDHCKRFWDAMDLAARTLGGWIETDLPEGVLEDPADVFFYQLLG